MFYLRVDSASIIDYIEIDQVLFDEFLNYYKIGFFLIFSLVDPYYLGAVVDSGKNRYIIEFVY
jgi:hypothetical protein